MTELLQYCLRKRLKVRQKIYQYQKLNLNF
jgi:hypothetical protein